MSKLQRITQKIFANEAASNDVAVFGSMKKGTPVYSDHIGDIMSLDAYKEGWQSAVSQNFAPFLEEMNGVEKVNTYQLAYCFQQGLPEWDHATEYHKGSWVKGINARDEYSIFESILNNNVGHPLTDESAWQEKNLGGTNGLPVASVISFDHPVAMAGLLPLNSDTYTTGYVIESCDQAYPSFWQLMVHYKTLGATDETYDVFNKTETQYNAALQASIQAGNAYCPYYVIDESAKTIRLPYWGKPVGVKHIYHYIVVANRFLDYAEAAYQSLLDQLNLKADKEDVPTSFDLFDFKFADHVLNNPGWVNAGYFSWHSGQIYVSAYAKLIAEKQSAALEPITETISGIEITYYKSENGFKICLPDQQDHLIRLYNATGSAWYYILDEENTQFKLPRSDNFIQGGARGMEVSTFMPAGLVQLASSDVNVSQTISSGANKMYLYFFMGNCVRNASLIDMGHVMQTLEKHAAYQTVQNIADQTVIPLNDQTVVYEKNVTADCALSFDDSGLSWAADYFTFEMYLTFPNGAQTVSFPENIKWLDENTPDFTTGKSYFLVFRKSRSWTYWVASVQGAFA